MTALVLQGGGALGAYQVGAYAALCDAGHAPDWICGTSIGAINAALIVGNAAGQKIEALKRFWRTVASPGALELPLPTTLRRQLNVMDALRAFLFGQPNFFWPRLALPFFALETPADSISFYDPSPLRHILGDLVDFEQIAGAPERLTLGSVKVTTGELVFFDNRRQRIGTEHVMASGAMPPNFPGVRVDGELYWDGSCVSNTPLEAIYGDPDGGADLAFVVDLFAPTGAEPSSYDAVRARKQEIDFASRSAAQLAWIVRNLNLQRRLRKAGGLDPEGRSLLTKQSERRLDIVHLCYAAPPYEPSTRDHDFSKASIDDRIQLGYEDMARVIDEAPWRDRAGDDGAVLHRRGR